MSPAFSCVFLVALLLLSQPTIANSSIITFRSLNLFPESAAWDTSARRFVVGSTRYASLHSVSDAGAVSTLVSDPDLPANVSVLGVALDPVRERVLAVVVAPRRFPPYDALAAYDLCSGRRAFLTTLSAERSDHAIANGVAVDPDGNAFVTSSMSNLIWKVDPDGVASVFSRSPIFQPSNVSQGHHYSWCGLNGIAYVGNSGRLLTVQTNTGRLFEVDAKDGTARLVHLEKTLTGAEAIAVRREGAAVVMAQHAAWLLRSDDGWTNARVQGEVALDMGRFPTGVAVKDGERAYVLYGRVNEGMGGGVDREEFSLEEIEWEEGRRGEAALALASLGLGLAAGYLLYRRFQMARHAYSMHRKKA